MLDHSVEQFFSQPIIFSKVLLTITILKNNICEFSDNSCLLQTLSLESFHASHIQWTEFFMKSIKALAVVKWNSLITTARRLSFFCVICLFKSLQDYAKTKKQNLMSLSAKAGNITRKSRLNFGSMLNNILDVGLIHVLQSIVHQFSSTVVMQLIVSSHGVVCRQWS